MARIDLGRIKGDDARVIINGIQPDNNGAITLTAADVGAANAHHTHTADSLGVPTLLGGTKIPTGSDLNDYTEVGNYCCAGDGDAKTLTNCPTQVAFNMKVFYANGEDGYIAQEIVEYMYGVRYFRMHSKYSGQWWVWVKDYTSASKPTPAEIGAATVAEVENALSVANSKAPAYTYGTDDLVAGTSTLETGTMYFVYE